MKLIDFFAGRLHNRGKRRPAKKSINFIGYSTWKYSDTEIIHSKQHLITFIKYLFRVLICLLLSFDNCYVLFSPLLFSLPKLSTYYNYQVDIIVCNCKMKKISWRFLVLHYSWKVIKIQIFWFVTSSAFKVQSVWIRRLLKYGWLVELSIKLYVFPLFFKVFGRIVPTLLPLTQFTLNGSNFTTLAITIERWTDLDVS